MEGILVPPSLSLVLDAPRTQPTDRLSHCQLGNTPSFGHSCTAFETLRLSQSNTNICSWHDEVAAVVEQAGPESAGAHPGPVCYRKGGHLAITDANLLLGRILPDFFPKIFGPNEDAPLDEQAARSVCLTCNPRFTSHSVCGPCSGQAGRTATWLYCKAAPTAVLTLHKGLCFPDPLQATLLS